MTQPYRSDFEAYLDEFEDQIFFDTRSEETCRNLTEFTADEERLIGKWAEVVEHLKEERKGALDEERQRVLMDCHEEIRNLEREQENLEKKFEIYRDLYRNILSDMDTAKRELEVDDV